jgi:hypothetical protein
MPTPGQWSRSLSVMRERTLGETDPSGAVFIGGMDGLAEELNQFSSP